MRSKIFNTGNYYLDIDNELTEMSAYELYIMNSKEIKEMLGVTEYQEIPLTEYWVSKLGFVKNQFDYNYWDSKSRISLYKSDDYKYFIALLDEVTIREVETVNDLQNLYKSFTGYQLTISAKACSGS